MTYPDTSGAERLTKEQLHLLLREVDLEYLVDRPGVLTIEINCASRKHLPVGCLSLSRLIEPLVLRTGDEELSLGVSRHNIAAVWVAFFSRQQRCCC